MVRKSTMTLAIMLASFLCITNCQKPPDNEKIVKIGAILDLTGPAASFGQMQRQGIDLAVADINAAPRCGHRVVSIIEDSRLEAKTAMAAATKLAEQDKIGR